MMDEIASLQHTIIYRIKALMEETDKLADMVFRYEILTYVLVEPEP